MDSRKLRTGRTACRNRREDRRKGAPTGSVGEIVKTEYHLGDIRTAFDLLDLEKVEAAIESGNQRGKAGARTLTYQ